jgi:hypothetical protein
MILRADFQVVAAVADMLLLCLEEMCLDPGTDKVHGMESGNRAERNCCKRPQKLL